MFREVSAIIKKSYYDPKLIDFQIGKPSEVEFDDLKAHLYIKENKCSVKDFLFIHVHPPGYGNDPSHQDLLCLYNMFKTFGNDETIYFGIIDFAQSFRPKKEFIKIYSYTYDSKRSRPIQKEINVITYSILIKSVDKYLPTLEYLSENLLLIEEK